jgi:hypothetical protein
MKQRSHARAPLLRFLRRRRSFAENLHLEAIEVVK